MNLVIARRTQEFVPFDTEDVMNPEWMLAPYELVDLDGPTTGPFRFKHKDIAQAEQFARDQNWDGLKQLSVPELIPPPKCS